MNKITYDKFEFEKLYESKGFNLIAGVDEVGRGPLCGPVVCCGIIMPTDDIIEGIDDSKKLSEKKREALYDLILKKAISVKICSRDSEEIDKLNILVATRRCMEDCINGLDVKPDFVLTDAMKLDIDIPYVPIVKGDLRSYTIGAASIVAKVYRDRLMKEYSKIYPQYDLDSNKGYGTKKHIEAIKEYGPCPIHRKTFIKNFLGSSENSEQLSF